MSTLVESPKTVNQITADRFASLLQETGYTSPYAPQDTWQVPVGERRHFFNLFVVCADGCPWPSGQCIWTMDAQYTHMGVFDEIENPETAVVGVVMYAYGSDEPETVAEVWATEELVDDLALLFRPRPVFAEVWA